MAASPRLLLALSVSSLLACAGPPPGSPPSADAVAGRFTTAAAPAPGFTNIYPFAAGNDWRIQGLYLPAEVGGSGRITAIGFYRAAPTVGAETCPSVTVRMGHSTLSALGTTFASNVDASTLTTVAAGVTIQPPAGAAGTWFTVPLSTPFDYDGVDGLVVDLETPAACAGTITIGTLNAASRRLLSVAVDSDSATSQHSPTTGGVDASPPGLQFTFAGGALLKDFGGGAPNCWPLAQDLRTQNLYLASDLQGSGPITGLGFQLYSPSVASTVTTSVRMAHTDATVLTTDFTSNIREPFTTVADDITFQVPGNVPAGGWLWVPLNGTFHFDGRRNVVVQFQSTLATAGCAQSLKYQSRTGARAWNNGANAAAATTVDGTLLHAAFRFAGAPVTIAPPQASAGASGQVLSGGQIMSLYDSTRTGSSGAVSKVAVRLNGPSTATTVPNVKIYMGTTSKTQLAMADTYASDLDGATLVYSGPLAIPAGLSRGDWLDIPLQSAFAYDATKLLSILFTSDTAPTGHTVATVTGTDFPSHSVGRNDNAVGLSGVPTWNYNGSVAVKLTVQ